VQQKLFGLSYLGAFFAIALLGALATEYVTVSEKRAFDNFHSLELKNKSGKLRSEIERVVNTTLQLSTGLVVYVAANPDVQDYEFAGVAASLIQKDPTIINVGLAKDNVLSHVYPLEGNKAALGLNYMKNEHQRGAVLRAISEINTVVAGPVNLVQGGRGLIGRIPIFLGPNGSDYWGIASVVVDFDAFESNILALAKNLGVDVVLKGKDASGLEGDVFIGDEASFSVPVETVMDEISLPVGRWVLFASYSQQPDFSAMAWGVRSIGYVVTLVIAVLSLLLMRAFYLQRHLSFHDGLTGLPNRRLFDDYAADVLSRARSSGSRFALLFIDMDNFKSINDEYGHRVGDIVLTALGSRIESVCHGSGFVARFGGDEFVVILEDVDSRESCQKLMDQLSKEVAKPIEAKGFWIAAKASAGVAIFPIDADTLEGLITCADGHMYSIKREAPVLRFS